MPPAVRVTLRPDASYPKEVVTPPTVLLVITRCSIVGLNSELASMTRI